MLLSRSERSFPRIIIIGGGFGGVEVARKLKDKEVEVLLIDRNNYHTFQPLMYQVATDTLAEDSISFPLRKMFAEQDNLFFRLAEVKYTDNQQKEVHNSVETFDYD